MQHEPDGTGTAGTAGPACTLCGRPLGRRVEQHHLVPRRYRGRETVRLHPICHRAIHNALSERALAQDYNTPDALRAHPDIARFLAWIADKPPDFHKRTERRRG